MSSRRRGKNPGWSCPVLNYTLWVSMAALGQVQVEVRRGLPFKIDQEGLKVTRHYVVRLPPQRTGEGHMAASIIIPMHGKCWGILWLPVTRRAISPLLSWPSVNGFFCLASKSQHYLRKDGLGSRMPRKSLNLNGHVILGVDNIHYSTWRNWSKSWSMWYVHFAVKTFWNPLFQGVFTKFRQN